MKPVKEIELVEAMLKQQTPHFATAQERVCWERGFLTGFLARLAHNDAGLRVKIANLGQPQH